MAFVLSTLLLLGTVAAQSQSSSTLSSKASTTKAAIPSGPVVVGPYLGYDTGIAVSIVAQDPCAITWVGVCTATSCIASGIPITATVAKSSYQLAATWVSKSTTQIDRATCAVSGTQAICQYTDIVATSGTYTVTTLVEKTSQSFVYYPITAGSSVSQASCTRDIYQPVATTNTKPYTATITGSLLLRSTSAGSARAASSSTASASSSSIVSSAVSSASDAGNASTLSTLSTSTSTDAGSTTAAASSAAPSSSSRAGAAAAATAHPIYKVVVVPVVAVAAAAVML